MTDWRYVKYNIPRLVEWLPDLSLHVQRSAKVTAGANLKYVAEVVKRKVFRSNAASEDIYRDKLDQQELNRSACGIVFSHRGYPQNAGAVPVVWQNSILDPEMTMDYLGCHLAVLQAEIEEKGASFHRAAVVQVSTDAECRRLGSLFPDIASRFMRTGFFAPDIRVCSAVAIDQKHRSPAQIEILFVGNEARRKGLDFLLDAYRKLPLLWKRRARLTIISRFADGKISIPDDDTIKVIAGADHGAVMNYMRRAHLLINPARFESFGFVFLEAMSQGAVAVGPGWEVQRELLEDGLAGVLVDRGASDLKAKLQWLIEDDDARLAIAQRARASFISRHAPDVVAAEFAAVFRAAAGDL